MIVVAVAEETRKSDEWFSWERRKSGEDVGVDDEKRRKCTEERQEMQYKHCEEAEEVLSWQMIVVVAAAVVGTLMCLLRM